jgi:hypothetical protein
MTTRELLAYLARNPATRDLGRDLAEIVDQRRALRRLAQDATGSRAA